MKTIEDAKRIKRLCSAVTAEWGKQYDLWNGHACELCGNCCAECTTLSTLTWIFPELKDYKVVATKEEWLKSEENV